MIIDKHISLWRLLGVIWKQILAMIFLASVIVIPLVYFNFGSVLDLTAPLILGTAISIFLGFRTNSAYDRWFLARGAWGSMRASSRNLSLVLARINGEDYINLETGEPSELAKTIMRRMIRRNIVWLWILGRQLKDLPPLQGTENLLTSGDRETIKESHNPALKLLFLQSRDFRIAQSEGQFSDGEHFEFVGIQRELVAGQTACEGLKNTPFPTHYSYFTHLFIWLFLVLLAFSLPGLENMKYLAIPAVVMVGWIFFMVEGIGSYMEEPFSNNRNVIPMDALSRSLEIDLKAIALEDEDIPKMIEPVDGALY